ncbi:hypothetical protein AGMMS4956_04920 [Bacteroidia bacterium]|nr:hypothetical protein AGMMS4956_04920 [Bacteroidia bacterium]
MKEVSKHNILTMKIIYAFLSLLLVVNVAIAQPKVVKKSGKQPAWAKTLAATDYLVAVGDGSTLSEAQQKALLFIKQEIVQSVAEQVMSVSTHTLQENDNNIHQSFAQTITAKAAKVPFVQGISNNQIEAVYWEKMKDKSAKKEWYRYYAKYPFSQVQLSKLVNDFCIEDNKITQRLAQLEDGLSTVSQTEQIAAALGELNILAQTLEDNRRQRAVMLQSRYNALYEQMRITLITHTLGQLECQLNIGNRVLQSAQTPSVKSVCATVSNIHIGNACIVEYNSDGCYRDIENFIELSYTFWGKKVTQKFLIPFQ